MFGQSREVNFWCRALDQPTSSTTARVQIVLMEKWGSLRYIKHNTVQQKLDSNKHGYLFGAIVVSRNARVTSA